MRVALTTLLFVLSTLSAAIAQEGGADCRKVLSEAQQRRAERFTPLDRTKREAAQSIRAFNEYFKVVNEIVLERGYIVDVMELALIAEEFVLMMGPPGNAKSQLSDLVFGNIQKADGSPSYYRIQMTPETTMSETHGPMDFKKLMKDNVYQRQVEEGMLLQHNIFIDEIFDARQNAMRNILGLLAERAHAQGKHQTQGLIQSGVAATNKYLSEVYERAGNDDPKAVIDRFALITFVPSEFESVDSYVSLIRGAKTKRPTLPTLRFEDLAPLRSMVSEVEIPNSVARTLALLSTRLKAETEALEQSALKSYKEKLRNGEDPGIPYRATKYHSPRTLGKAAGILKAIVVRDWIRKNGKRRLTATLEDLKTLEKFFTLNGPSENFVKDMFERSTNPHERSQLHAILQERESFRRHLREITDEIGESTVRYALDSVAQELAAAQSPAEREALTNKLLNQIVEIDASAVVKHRQSDLSGQDIGMEYVRDYLIAAVKDLLPQERKNNIEGELDATRARMAEEFRRQETNARLKAEREAEAIERAQRIEALRQQRLQEEESKIRTKAEKYGGIVELPELKDASSGENPVAIDPTNNRLAIKVSAYEVMIYDLANLTANPQRFELPELPRHGTQRMSFMKNGKLVILTSEAPTAVVITPSTRDVRLIALSMTPLMSPPLFDSANNRIVLLFSPPDRPISAVGLDSNSPSFTASVTSDHFVILNAFVSGINGGTIKPWKTSPDGSTAYFLSSSEIRAFALDLKNWKLEEVHGQGDLAATQLHSIENGEFTIAYQIRNQDGSNSRLVPELRQKDGKTEVHFSHAKVSQTPHSDIAGLLIENNRILVEVSPSNNDRLTLFDSNTGNQLHEIPFPQPIDSLSLLPDGRLLIIYGKYVGILGKPAE